MERRVTPLRRVTPPTWGPPPPCKQALNLQVFQERLYHKSAKANGTKSNGIMENASQRLPD